MPVIVSADKRFLRAHVRPVRRHGWWRGIARAGRTVIALAIAATGILYGARLVRDAPVLRIDHITVRGIERLSRGEVLALLDDLHGRSLLRVDLDAARRRLLESPWVADAVLRRRLPATLDIVITERRPIGIGRLNGELFLVDETGHVIDEFGPKYAEFDLPIVDGLAGPGGIDPLRVALASRVIRSIARRPDLAGHVSQIDVSDPVNAVVLLDTESALLRLGDQQFLERLESYLELAPRLHDSVPAIDYVDLRYGSKVFVGTGATGRK